MSLDKIKIRDAEYVTDAASSSMVFHVKDPHALIQAAGYLKYIHADKSNEGVYFRGETRIHSSLSPTLFRGITTHKTQSKNKEKLSKTIEHIRSKDRIFEKFSSRAHEPLLQHYGLRTSWIDLVDNIWVALWFACHKAHSIGKYGEFLHFERRSHYKENNAFAYVLLIGVGIQLNKIDDPGIIIGKTTELIDLRVAAPSIFLRPHAQHGLLFRCRGNQERRPTDYGCQIRGIIRASLYDALSWLGDGKMLGVHTLFPPPYYDRGFSILLEAGAEGSKIVGAIAHVGA